MSKRTEPYAGPFPRGRHSHRCNGCAYKYGQFNGVACYRSKCTSPQLLDRCSWCDKNEAIKERDERRADWKATHNTY